MSTIKEYVSEERLLEEIDNINEDGCDAYIVRQGKRRLFLLKAKVPRKNIEIKVTRDEPNDFEATMKFLVFIGSQRSEKMIERFNPSDENKYLNCIELASNGKIFFKFLLDPYYYIPIEEPVLIAPTLIIHGK